MSVDYHGWTHRPKALGGTDPIPASDVTAAFLLRIPFPGDEQKLSSPDGWVPVILPPGDPSDFDHNWDMIDDGVAVEIINDSNLTPGDVIVFRTADYSASDPRHYWHVGATIAIGGFGSTYPAVAFAGEALEPNQGAVAVRPWAVGLRIGDRGEFASRTYPEDIRQVIPDYQAGGDYAYFFNGKGAWDGALTLSVAGSVDISRVQQDPGDTDEDREGLQVQVYHDIDVTPDSGVSPQVDHPAVRGGFVWGFRYAIGDGITS